MSILDISVNERNLFFKNTPTITTESRDIDYVRFDFEDTSWSEYTKFCVFMDSSEQNKISRLLEVDFKAKIPNSFLRKEEYMYIGLCGVKTTGEEITSTVLIYNPAKGIFDIGESVEPPSNFYDQALENYNQILNLCNEINETYDSLMENLPFYNVKYFGAIGDGISDDSTAIQNTINTARDAGGGVVYFPSGTYYFSKSITFASSIKLLGDTNTIFTADKDLGYDADGLKIYDYNSIRTSTFLNIGTANSEEYNGFSNVEINNIIFDLGGQWWFDGSNRLNYRAKYNPSQPYGSFKGFYSYCPIIACHGDGLRIINCTFKNGIYGGYTGNAGTNPHIMDIGGVKNILIEGCTFEPLFMTTTGISCWKGVNTTDTGMPDPINCEPIQFDACYGDGGTSGVKGRLDGTICRDIVVRNNKFYGLPNYDWRDVQNKTGDNDFIIIELNKQISNGSTTVSYDVSYAQWRFASYPAIGTCHITTSASVTPPGSSSSIQASSVILQPQNVEIYDNYFEGHWPSHYSGSTLLGNTAFIKAIAENNIDSSGRLLPINEWKYEPARKFCNGAIYAYPGARGYNIHNNIFKELTSYTENKSTAVFLYGSLAGIVHDNTFIDFGEPLPVGIKNEDMNGINFESEDAWSSRKTGYYDGLAYCNSSNNIWIKDGELTKELDIKAFWDKTYSEDDKGKIFKINEEGKVELAPGHSFLYINAKDFGAIGDGRTDSAGIVQNILDEIKDYGGTIFFPNGTYYFSQGITFGSNIKLLGDTDTIFTADKELGVDSQGKKIYDFETIRNSTFFNIGKAGSTKYNGFTNVEINNIIFDLGGQWKLEGEILTYRAKYSPESEDRKYFSYCPIVAAHGDGLKIINCTFRNGIYGGYTGSAQVKLTNAEKAEGWTHKTIYGTNATNPHIMDIAGTKNILIENCVFETMFTSSTGLINWTGHADNETGQPDVNYSDLIQLDAKYGDGGTSLGVDDGTNCRDVIIRNNKFYGLPKYNWKEVVNNTDDGEYRNYITITKYKKDKNDTILDSSSEVIDDHRNTILINNSNNKNYSEWRFAKYAAVGTCHVTTNKTLANDTVINYAALQPYNVEIYNNYFEGSWSSHYDGTNPAGSPTELGSDGTNYPIINEKREPARKFCHGAIYAYPGAKGYNIHNNTFKENLPCSENKSTAVFLYGSLGGTVHDNIFIEYGEPLPFGIKTENMSGINFESEDEWFSGKVGYYNGLQYCKSSNNIWVRNNKSYQELNQYKSFFDVKDFGAIGDGRTDDGWSIQTAINRCRDTGGGTVHFPKGVYNITRALFYYSNMTFKFEEGATIRPMTSTTINTEGKEVVISRTPSILFAPYFDTRISYLSHKTETSGFAANRYGVENVTFDGGTISGNSWEYVKISGENVIPEIWEWKDEQHNAVLELCLCKNIKICNMTFSNCNSSGGHAIEINSSTDIIIEKCRFVDAQNNGNDGTYQEYVQIDAATCYAIGSTLTITRHEEKYISPTGVGYNNWYSYLSKTSNLGILSGYFDFTLLAPGGMYDGSDVQDIITEKLIGNPEGDIKSIQDERGFHQCCHNIEIANCYFENAEDGICTLSAIGNHTNFKGNDDYSKETIPSGKPEHNDKYYERSANFDQDKHSGIRIHDNVFIWSSNQVKGGTADSEWRGVIAFGHKEGFKWRNTHVYNVSIYGNIFYRDKNFLTTGDSTDGEEKKGYAITACRGDNGTVYRYTKENNRLPQTKYRIYGNLYAGLNGWEAAATTIQDGASLLIT